MQVQLIRMAVVLIIQMVGQLLMNPMVLVTILKILFIAILKNNFSWNLLKYMMDFHFE